MTVTEEIYSEKELEEVVESSQIEVIVRWEND